MRRLVAGVSSVALLFACSSDYGVSDPAKPFDAGGAQESGVADASPDGPPRDDAAPDARDATMPSSNCTLFDKAPRTIAGWTVDGPKGGATLASAPQVGRPAVVATVAAAGQRAGLVRDVQPGPKGEIHVTVDVLANTTTSFSGSLIELVTIACTAPPQRLSLIAIPDGTLRVEPIPSSSGTVVAIGSPPNTWQTLVMEVVGNRLTVTFGNNPPVTILLDSSYAGGVGCTLEVGAVANGNVGMTTGAFARACVD